MFGLFKRDSEIDTLQKKYNKMMKKWYKLSIIDRKASDQVFAEAQLIAEQIDGLKAKN